jgi:hypothetical protein
MENRGWHTEYAHSVRYVLGDSIRNERRGCYA